jgi:predicted AAA+ superfamily ATPase
MSLRLLGGNEDHPAYLNWDAPGVARGLRQGELPPDQKLLVLDEIHKYEQWRNLVKGIYDTNKSSRRFLITGSARLDYYRHGGDSLQGRYFYYRLHPLSAPELGLSADELDKLIQMGGFPEPYFENSPSYWRRWQTERNKRVVQEDLLTLEEVVEVKKLDLLVKMLPERVGSTLSVQSLSEDLAASHKTIERWVTILENLYFCFRIPPYGAPKVRALKKAQKLYLWDWSLCPERGAKIENMVASHLLKYCHYMEDTQGEEMDLRFLRDTDGREIDFVVLKNGKPQFAVEVKSGERQLSPHIPYFAERTDIPIFYQVHLGKKDQENKNGKYRVIPFINFCKTIGIP